MLRPAHRFDAAIAGKRASWRLATERASETRVKQYGYDNRGRGYRTIRYAVNRQTGAITGSQTRDTTYDQASSVLREEQITNYLYDDYGRASQTIWPDHVPSTVPGDLGYGITQTQYDALNRVLRTTDQLGDTVTNNYDAARRRLSKDYRTRANSPSGPISDSDTFTYNANSLMLTAVFGRYSNTVTLGYDAASRQTSNSLTIFGVTYTSTTQYDAAGRVIKLTHPDASEVNRGYTARGQLHTLALGSTTIDTRAYDDGGRLTVSTYNNGVSESRAYDDDSLVTTINFTGAAIGNLGYTWDVNHNKTSETIAGTMSGYGFTAGYDADDRLTSWQRASTTLDQSWNLSPVGNWNSFTENASTQVRTHSPANEILTAASQAVQHDPKGNATLLPLSLRPAAADPLALEWDFNNRLQAADTDNSGTDDVFYLWDALGRRVGRTAGGTTTVYFQDGQQTLAEYVASAPSNSPTHNYIWGSYIDELVLRTSSSGNHYFHRNQQYSIIAATASAGTIAERYAYTAYGELTILDASGTPITASVINNRYTYTGREWDAALALYHYRARMYSPLAGRFISRDPIGYVDGTNLYRTYLGASKLDPSGKCVIGRKEVLSTSISVVPTGWADPQSIEDAIQTIDDIGQYASLIDIVIAAIELGPPGGVIAYVRSRVPDAKTETIKAILELKRKASANYSGSAVYTKVKYRTCVEKCLFGYRYTGWVTGETGYMRCNIGGMKLSGNDDRTYGSYRDALIASAECARDHEQSI